MPFPLLAVIAAGAAASSKQQQQGGGPLAPRHGLPPGAVGTPDQVSMIGNMMMQFEQAKKQRMLRKLRMMQQVLGNPIFGQVGGAGALGLAGAGGAQPPGQQPQGAAPPQGMQGLQF